MFFIDFCRYGDSVYKMVTVSCACSVTGQEATSETRVRFHCYSCGLLVIHIFVPKYQVQQTVRARALQSVPVSVYKRKELCLCVVSLMSSSLVRVWFNCQTANTECVTVHFALSLSLSLSPFLLFFSSISLSFFLSLSSSLLLSLVSLLLIMECQRMGEKIACECDCMFVGSLPPFLWCRSSPYTLHVHAQSVERRRRSQQRRTRLKSIERCVVHNVWFKAIIEGIEKRVCVLQLVGG